MGARDVFLQPSIRLPSLKSNTLVSCDTESWFGIKLEVLDFIIR